MTAQITHSSIGDAQVLTVSGEVDLANSADLRAALLDVLGSAPARVVVDLTAVPFLDSTGLGALAAGLERADDVGSVIAVVCPDVLRRLFAITGLDAAFDVVGTLDEALGAVVHPRPDAAQPPA